MHATMYIKIFNVKNNDNIMQYESNVSLSIISGTKRGACTLAFICKQIDLKMTN